MRRTHGRRASHPGLDPCHTRFGQNQSRPDTTSRIRRLSETVRADAQPSKLSIYVGPADGARQG